MVDGKRRLSSPRCSLGVGNEINSSGNMTLSETLMNQISSHSYNPSHKMAVMNNAIATTENTFHNERIRNNKNVTDYLKNPVNAMEYWSKNDTPYLTMYGTHQADESFLLLPEWLQTYFEWHNEQTQKRDEDTKYIVLGCLGKCGGVSDRLRPLPFYLLYASLVPRVICIHWPTPFGLENYLMPPVGSSGRVVDWRCPSDVSDALPKYGEDTYFRVDCRRKGNQSYLCYEDTIKKMQTNSKKYVFLDLVSFSVELVNTILICTTG